MNTEQIDYLIVGAGIAGTVLALQLLENGNSIKIYNKEDDSSASHVAAGIINPVTGQRFVRSWMYDQLMSVASDFYEHYDSLWGTSYFKHTKINRALFSKNEVVNFENREGDPHYNQYFEENKKIETKHFRDSEDWCTIHGGRLDLTGFILEAKKYLMDHGCKFVNELLDFDQLNLDSDFIQYKSVQFEKMVCCEGIGIVNNPLFNHLPMVPAKGECLLLEIPSITTTDIYKHKVFFVPLNEDNQFWVGANYDWDFVDASPTNKGYEWLLGKVRDSLQVPFNVKKHIAAVRPTGKDRRPYLGRHNEHADVFVFNALGTKGSSLAPYWADQLIQHMEEGQELAAEVSIERFEIS